MQAFLLILATLVTSLGATQLRAGRRGKGGGLAVGRLVGGGKVVENGMSTEAVASSLDEVIEVLANMLQEFNTQATEDKENWEKYQKWSDDSEADKNDFMNDQNALIMSSESKKSANQQMVQKLIEDLGKLSTEIMETEASLKQLAQMRAEERAQFEAALADVTKTIAAVNKATQILAGHYSADKAALNEIRARVQMALTTSGLHISMATQDNVKMLASLLQGGAKEPDYLNVDGKAAYDKFDSQQGGHGVMGMLEDLRTQLESQRQELVQKENEAQRQYEETKAAKEADLANARQLVAEKTEQQAKCEATIEEMIATINQATKDVADAKAYLAQLLADRAEFTKVFGERTAMRKSEQAATQAALDALQSVSAGAKSGVGEFMQAASFIQTGSHKFAANSNARAKVMQITTKLIQVGREMHSMALVRMASNLKSKFDPYMETQQQDHYDEGSFGPVIKLLSDLIGRLEEEQNAETSQHEWCETEKASGVANQQEREKNIHALKGTIESLTTEIAQLKTEILFLESEIARVKEETRIAKQIRADENAVFLTAKKDHEEVIGAIQTAIAALTGQYSLAQLKTSVRRQSPFSEYKSGGAGAGSAMEMLEDLQTRYTEALTKLVTEEEEAQAAHEDLLKRNAQFLAETTAARNAKLAERRRQINELSSDKEDMKTNLLELHDVSKYLQDLRPSCDDIRTTYAERKKRREAEIAALKEALEVLSDPSMMA